MHGKAPLKELAAIIAAVLAHPHTPPAVRRAVNDLASDLEGSVPLSDAKKVRGRSVKTRIQQYLNLLANRKPPR